MHMHMHMHMHMRMHMRMHMHTHMHMRMHMRMHMCRASPLRPPSRYCVCIPRRTVATRRRPSP